MMRGRWTVRRAQPADDGFTLVELIVAMFVIAIILTSLALVQTRAMVTIAQAKERQQASALANQTLEQLRALPWDTLKKGLSNFYPAGSDPNVTGGRLRPPAASTIDEILVISTSQATNGTAAPLAMAGGSNAQSIQDAESAANSFSVRTYVTQGAAGATGPINLTVIVSWERRGDGNLQTTIARSTAYSPSGGCGGTGNQPFLAACQAFYTAEGGVGPATITIAGTQPVPPNQSPDPTLLGPWRIMAGLDEDQTNVALGTVGSSATSEQSTTARASTVGAGLVSSWLGTPVAESGMTSGDLVASNDISGVFPANPSPVTVLSSSANRTLTGTNGQIVISAPSAVSTTGRAAMTAGCNTPGINVACSRGESAGGSSLQATLSSGTTTVNLAQVVAGSSYGWSGRYVAAAGTATTGCSTVSGTGCAASGAHHVVGTVSVGTGVAWDGAAAPTGLVRITGYNADVRAQYGTSQLSVVPTATRGGTVRWWNGTAYQDTPISSTTDTTLILGTVTRTDGATTIRAVGSVTVLPATVIRTNTDPTCQTDGCSLEVTMPAVTVAVTYTVTTPTGESAFTVVTSLGAPRAAASFKAAPLA